MLGGYMAGVTVSGVLWAVFQNNAGGAWDNAKKSFEAGVEINGEMTYKGSEAHKAAVTGDTVGDPFKDTSGPSMNILIKLTCLIGLVIAPILGNGTAPEAKEMKCVIKMSTECSEDMGKCDMSKCATMTKDECAAMCDSLKCSPEQKEMCLSNYDANGKFVAPKECEEGESKSCCAKKEDKNVNVTITNDNGKAKATVITTEKGKATTQVFEGSLKDVKAKVEAME
jgi:K(+)-stimulated pyrophosphate-energized sodium pump